MKRKIRKEITNDVVMLIQKGSINIRAVYLMYGTKNVTELYISTDEKHPEIDSYTGNLLVNGESSQGFCVNDSVNFNPEEYSPTVIEFEGSFDTLIAHADKGGIRVVLIRKTKKEPVFLFEMRKTKK